MAAEIAEHLQERVETRRKGLLKEQRKIPREVATLKSEGKKLAESMADADGTARRLIDERLAEIEQVIAMLESRLVDAQRMLVELDAQEVEGRWVTETLSRFDKVWEALNVLNQARLVRAIVRQVLIDEENGTVEVLLADIGLDDEIDGEEDEDTQPAPPTPLDAAPMEAHA